MAAPYGASRPLSWSEAEAKWKHCAASEAEAKWKHCAASEAEASPLLGWVIGSCAMADVPYAKWFRWVFPKVILFIAIACVVVFVLTVSGWSGVI